MPPQSNNSAEFDLNRVHGRDVVVQFNGETWTNWDKVSIKPVGGKFGRNAADAKFEQKTKGRVDATGTLSFIMGGKNVPSYIPPIFTEITDLKFEVAANGDLMPADLGDPTKYGKCRVMSTPFEQADAPGTISIEIEWGFTDED